MPLKIAHINLAKGLRGGENQTLAIIEGLKHFEIEQTLICRKNSLLEQHALKLNISVIAIQKPFLLNVTKLKSFDLVHVHEGRSIYFALAANLLFQTSYIVTRRIPNTLHNKCITRMAYKKASFIVSISKAVDDVMKTFCLNYHVVIPDIARFLNANNENVMALRKRFLGKFVIGHVGALSDHHKNQSLILKTASQLRYNKDIVFILLGIGKDEGKLKQLAAELNLTNVVFEGFKENIGDYFALFDIFVYPSKEEGLGSAILEAFHFNKPVIAANIGGIPDILGDNEYGLLIDPFDENQLAETILTLYRNTELRNHYAMQSAVRKTCFSADEICDCYFQIYQNTKK